MLINPNTDTDCGLGIGWRVEWNWGHCIVLVWVEREERERVKGHCLSFSLVSVMTFSHVILPLSSPISKQSGNKGHKSFPRDIVVTSEWGWYKLRISLHVGLWMCYYTVRACIVWWGMKEWAIVIITLPGVFSSSSSASCLLSSHLGSRFSNSVEKERRE
jgi:hypothetical protein